MTVETQEQEAIYTITVMVAGSNYNKESQFIRTTDRASAHQWAQGELANLIMANSDCVVSTVTVVKAPQIVRADEVGD